MQGSPLLTDDAPAQTATGAGTGAQPLVTGEALYLWTGAGAVLLVFVLMFILLGRWRSGRRARNDALDTDFFQPAGEGAEITFDDARAVGGFAARDAEGGHVFEDDPVIPAPKPRKPSAFAGLFSKKDKRAEVRDPAFADVDGADESLAEIRIERNDDPVMTAEPIADWRDIEREAQQQSMERAAREAEESRLAAQAESHARWRAVEEERQRQLAQAEQARADEEAARRAAEMQAQTFRHDHARAPHDDIVRTLSEVEEALHVQREAIQAETRNLLDSFARRFSERLDSLAHSMEKRAALGALSPGSADGSDDAGHMLEEIARRLDEHRSEVSGALSALSQRLDQAAAAPSDSAQLRSELAELRRSLNGKATPAAPAVQLADIVRNALAPSGYELDAMLPNNRRADCLIKLARPPGPIAIDARFPVEAFHALHERRSAAADNEFRRTALRHVVDVAERMICPGFTADSAILFLPSESMAGELHARFPDLIQDSYRARVWIVSPTTLMATLHTLSAFLRDAPRREGSLAAETTARRALSEVERLSERIAALEKNAAQPRIEPKDLKSANDAAGRRPVEPYREQPGAEPAKPLQDETAPADEEKRGDLYADEEPGDARRQTQPRPPFPLR